ncbi:hypothetical protein QJ522_00470 [Sedimentisphaerales bacterium M17dextr]|uniref:Uncharacterized protein n=1 Tax=Anaerobaca lacustris TaxID=3044600 RepID=A0AAW6TSC4_9BACT|nr:hypothetical protein [Sedimentisphaerales bacterium M17dextr]
MGYSQDDDNPDFPAGTSGASVTSTYGDNITQSDIDAGYYGAAGGPTPNVLVWNDYETIYVKVGDDGYGDLPSVLCSPYNWYMIEFKTDNNHLIDLYGFEMATRADEGAQITVDLLIDGQLVKRLSPHIFGKAIVDGLGRVHFDTSDAQGESGTYGFGTITGRHLGIRIWPNPLGEDVGITNIHFSQREDFQSFAPAPAPETTDVSLDTASLAWTSHDDVAYDVWFGTTADLAGVTPVRTAESALDLADTARPPNWRSSVGSGSVTISGNMSTACRTADRAPTIAQAREMSPDAETVAHDSIAKGFAVRDRQVRAIGKTLRHSLAMAYDYELPVDMRSPQRSSLRCPLRLATYVEDEPLLLLVVPLRGRAGTGGSGRWTEACAAREDRAPPAYRSQWLAPLDYGRFVGRRRFRSGNGRAVCGVLGAGRLRLGAVPGGDVPVGLGVPPPPLVSRPVSHRPDRSTVDVGAASFPTDIDKAGGAIALCHG